MTVKLAAQQNTRTIQKFLSPHISLSLSSRYMNIYGDYAATYLPLRSRLHCCSTINAKAKTSQDSCLNNFLAVGTIGKQSGRARNKRQAGNELYEGKRRLEWGIRRKLLSTAKARPKTTTSAATSRVATWRRHCWRAEFWFDEFITFDVQTRKTAAGHKTSQERQTFDKQPSRDGN